MRNVLNLGDDDVFLFLLSILFAPASSPFVHEQGFLQIHIIH